MFQENFSEAGSNIRVGYLYYQIGMPLGGEKQQLNEHGCLPKNTVHDDAMKWEMFQRY